jgi:hypothetical protein
MAETAAPPRRPATSANPPCIAFLFLECSWLRHDHGTASVVEQLLRDRRKQSTAEAVASSARSNDGYVAKAQGPWTRYYNLQQIAFTLKSRSAASGFRRLQLATQRLRQRKTHDRPRRALTSP